MPQPNHDFLMPASRCLRGPWSDRSGRAGRASSPRVRRRGPRGLTWSLLALCAPGAGRTKPGREGQLRQQGPEDLVVPASRAGITTVFSAIRRRDTFAPEDIDKACVLERNASERVRISGRKKDHDFDAARASV